MTYSIPVKTGKHTLILKFAEVFYPRLRCTFKKLEKEFSISRLVIM